MIHDLLLLIMILIQHCTICCDAVSVKKCSDTSVRSPVTWMTPPRSSNKISCTLTFPANPGLSVGGTTLGGELTSTSDSIRSCQLRYQNRHISSIWTYWFFFFKYNRPLQLQSRFRKLSSGSAQSDINGLRRWLFLCHGQFDANTEAVRRFLQRPAQ